MGCANISVTLGFPHSIHFQLKLRVTKTPEHQLFFIFLYLNSNLEHKHYMQLFFSYNTYFETLKNLRGFCSQLPSSNLPLWRSLSPVRGVLGVEDANL